MSKYWTKDWTDKDIQNLVDEYNNNYSTNYSKKDFIPYHDTCFLKTQIAPKKVTKTIVKNNLFGVDQVIENLKYKAKLEYKDLPFSYVFNNIFKVTVPIAAWVKYNKDN